MAASRITIVVAMDRHGAIGKGGALPWRLTDDLKHFKTTTMGHVVLMGRKTYDTIGHPLPGRTNLVLTRDDDWAAADVTRVTSMDDAIRLAQGGELMVIGGGEVYALALPLAHRLVITRVNTVVKDADTYFPYVNNAIWKETDEVSYRKGDGNDHAFTIRTLERTSGGSDLDD